MRSVLEPAKKVATFFQQVGKWEEETLANGFSLLKELQKELTSKDDFFTLYSCFVNLYFIYGVHLSVPENAKKNPKQDTRSYFSGTRNDDQFFYYENNQEELLQNRECFLAQLKTLSCSEEDHRDLEALYLGIYLQKKDYFLPLLEKNYAIVDYYLYYMAMREHILAIELRKNKEISKNEFLLSKKELCATYDRYKNRGFFFPEPEQNNSSLAVGDRISQNIPHLPLPTIRYSDSLCEEMVECHKGLNRLVGHVSHIQKDQIQLIHRQLREIVKNQQLGTIRPKGKINQKDLYSNVSEIRMGYLMFPLRIDFDRNTFSLLMQNYLDYRQLEEKQRLLKQHQEVKDDLLKQHAHNWGHMNYPSILGSVAKELYKEGNIAHATTLNYVYDDFLLHQNDLKLLKLKYNAQTPDAFLDEFMRSLAAKNAKFTNHKVASMRYLLEDSLRLTLFRMLFSAQEESGKDNSFKLHREKTQAQLQERFSAHFMKTNQEDMSVIEWFNQEIHSFEVEGLVTTWESIGFLQGEMAYSFLQQVILHLLSNALNYGVKTKEGSIKFIFYRELLDGEPYLSFRVENTVHKESAFIPSHGYGINGIKDSIARLNTTEDKDAFTTVEEKEGWFSIDMKIHAHSLVLTDE